MPARIGLRMGQRERDWYWVWGCILITAKAPGCSYSYSEWLWLAFAWLGLAWLGCLPDDGVAAGVVVVVVDVVSLLSPAYH